MEVGLFKRDKTASSTQNDHSAVDNLSDVDVSSIVDLPEFDERTAKAVLNHCDLRLATA